LTIVHNFAGATKFPQTPLRLLDRAGLTNLRHQIAMAANEVRACIPVCLRMDKQHRGVIAPPGAQ